MRWLFVLTVTSSLQIYASSFGSISTVTSCSTESTTESGVSNCAVTVPIGGSNYVIDAHASASASGLPWSIHVQTETIGDAPPSDYNWAAAAQATASADFYTTGLPRTGLIQFDVRFAEQFDDFGLGALISDGTNSYLFYPVSSGPVAPICADRTCEFRGTLPFLLGGGNTFHVALTGLAIANNSCAAGGCPGGDASLNLSLLEADGITTVSFAPVPEPQSYVLVWFGLAGFTGVRRRRKR